MNQVQPAVRVLCVLCVWICLAALAPAQVRVMADEVSDTRRSDGFFNKLEIKVKLLGDALAEARAVRLKVNRAVDATGRNLLGGKTNGGEFAEISSSGENPKLDIELKNPARRAVEVTEISGMLEIFSPQKDPAATVRIANALAQTGQPLAHAGLRAQGVALTLWTREQFEARKKEEEARLKQQAESKRDAATAELGEEMAAGLMKLFGGLFNVMSEMDENSIALQLDDKQSRVLAIEFEDAEGNPISRNSRSSMGDNPRTMIFGFEQKLPANAKLTLYLLTPKSLLRVPFKLANIPLP
jgi:hypothetical protein